jgi:cell division protein FtsL
MGRRFTDTSKWKNQRWYRLLPAYYKLSWEYINGLCDISGLWEINWPDLLDDLKIPAPHRLTDFIEACNRDYDMTSGEEFVHERIIRINDNFLWITTYMMDQYKSEENTINPANNYVKAAIQKLCHFGRFFEAFERGFLPLPTPFEPPSNPLPRGSEGIIGYRIIVNRIEEKEIERWYREHVNLILEDSKKTKKNKVEKKAEEPSPEKTLPGSPESPAYPAAYTAGLCQRMVDVFCNHFPKYFRDPKKDFPAVTSIANKIADQNGWPRETITNGKLEDVITQWEDHVIFARADVKWFSGRDLSDIDHEWQRLIQKQTSEKANEKSTKLANAPSRKVSQPIPKGGFGQL